MNKELLGKIEAFFLMPLILIYYVLLSKRVINLIISDICVSEMPKVSFWSFAYNFSIHEDFRSTVYIRLGWKRIFVSWMKPGAKCFYNLTKHYGDSLFIQHGFATVVYAKSVGHHFFVNQQVTIGFGDDGNPTIGNYVSVRAGAKIIGNVNIGDDVVIGANAVVVKDVPSHSVVVGVPGRIIKTSNPQPIGFSGILLAKRQNSFYCTYFLHNRNVADTKSPYPIKRLEVIRWFNQKSMVFNQSLS